MNYIFIHWAYGRKSMEMTVDRMTEPCHIIARKKNGEMWEYGRWRDGQEKNEWRQLSSLWNNFYKEDNNVINWGNHIYREDKYFRLNKPSAIALASNKAVSRRFLRDAGIHVPVTWFLGEREPLNLGGKFIARPPYHHGGNNFYVVGSVNELARKIDGDTSTWYFSEIFPKTHEFRVHCAHGKVLQVSNKPLAEGEIRANHSVVEESWRALKWSEFNDLICEQSLKAVKVLGLDYGAVDIMWNSDTNRVAICEVNTSPSITTEYSSGKYAEYFSWVIRHNFPKHFKIEEKHVFYSKMLRD